MRSTTQLSKWGHSLAIRIPREVVREAGLAEGDRLSLQVNGGGEILLRASRPNYTLDDLVSRITPKNRHAAIEWGAPVGKESW